jgi:hypothetical protein
LGELLPKAYLAKPAIRSLGSWELIFHQELVFNISLTIQKRLKIIAEF